MIEEHDNELDPRLPPDLAALDEELRAIGIAERPSFGPELEAELRARWREMRLREARPRWGRFAAAAVVALALVGLGAPQARASLAWLLTALRDPEPVQPAAEPLPPAPGPLPEAPLPTLVEPTLPEPGDGGDGAAVDPGVPLPGEAPDPMVFTMPEILDREAVEEAVRAHYPRELQRAGVGGEVLLRLWVTYEGRVDHVQIIRGSGVPELDRAALEVAPDLRFSPSRLRGQPVGTWVEIPIQFEPRPGADAGPDAGLSVAAPATGVRPLDLELPEEFVEGDFLASPATEEEARGLLARALGEDARRDPWRGRLDALVRGQPPEGEFPTRWRTAAATVLEGAVERDPVNPLPALALARVRRAQGLRTQALTLLD
ncbi:MAG: energy transducer TonB, partial [Gemmatimonadetes bacterium]